MDVESLLLGFLGDDNGVNLGNLLILGDDLDVELVFAFLQSQICRQLYGSFGVIGFGSDLDFLYILVGIGIQLILGGILVEVLDAGAAVDPQNHQVGIVAEMIAADAVVVLGILGINVGGHTDLAAAGTLHPVILVIAAVASVAVVVGIMIRSFE